MTHATDADLSHAWAGAVRQGRISRPIGGRYNGAVIFKRAEGAGRITRHEGLDHLLAEYGEHVVALDLLPVGAPRRDWRAGSIDDGTVRGRRPGVPQTNQTGGCFAPRPPPHTRPDAPPSP